MDDAKPRMEPGGMGMGRRSTARYAAPSQMVSPDQEGGIATTEGAPPVMTASLEQAAPSLPVAAAREVSAWQNSKKLTALWSNGQARNSWIGVDGIGWKKLSNANDTSSVALTLLCMHAREKERAINYRDESDGMIHEIYVW